MAKKKKGGRGGGEISRAEPGAVVGGHSDYIHVDTIKFPAMEGIRNGLRSRRRHGYYPR